MNKKYDAAVIGGGPGGYVAAIRLAQLGKKTALIEKRELGGTCLNRGCIPTKALLQSAEVYRTVKEAGKFGITATAEFDYKKISETKDRAVSRMRNGVAYLEKKAGVDIIAETAAFKDRNTIIAGEDEIYADNVIIATGSAPARIPVHGIDLDGVVDSDYMLSLTECPESIVIIGGGVIGIEFATLYAALGVKVSVVEMLPEILPPIDPEIAGLMRKELENRGVAIFTGAKVEKIESGLTVHFEQNGAKTATGELCIVAVGRKPVTNELGLENIGLKTDRGFIPINEYMRTNVPGVYAVGDVTGKVQLAHVASAQGIAAAHNITGEKKKVDYGIVPSCVYTEPEIACVGLTEQQAKQKGLNIKVGRFRTAANGRSVIMGETAGMVKLVTEERTGEILGCHIMAPRATEMIGEICAAIRAQGTVEELGDTIHAHPTVSEMIMEAAHDTDNMSVNQ